jgi:N-alpha-acetyl-L-2,4-diaminobutyrate deacetylase
VIARVYDPAPTGRAPAEYGSGLDGVLLGRHFPGMIGIGDIIAVTAVPQA